MNKQATPTKNLPANVMTNWFDGFIGELRSHELRLETNTAPKELVDFYSKIFIGDSFAVTQTTREMTTIFYVKNIVLEFLKGLNEKGSNVKSLSLSYSDSNVRMWCIINDNDIESENTLFHNEAIINAKYYQYGFHLSLTIVEESDNIPVPANFENFYNRGSVSGTPQAGKA